MAVDVSPEILEEIEKNFEEYYKDPNVRRIYKKIVEGTATYPDIHILSRIVGKHMAESAEKAYTKAKDSGKLPDGKLYENIVEKTLGPTLRNGHGIISEACGFVQKDLNRKSGTGLGAVEPVINEKIISGIIHDVANRNEVELSQTALGGVIETFAITVVDDYVRANLEFQKEAGLVPTISRTRGSHSNSKCAFCAGLVYSGEYKGAGMPEGIFKRHRDCHCNVLYTGVNGKVQDVWSKQEYNDYREAQKAQREYLNNLDKMTPDERRLARNARARELRRAKYTPEEWQRRKVLEKINAERAASTGLSLEERQTYRGLAVETPKTGMTAQKRAAYAARKTLETDTTSGMFRKEGNLGVFSHLPERMSKKHIRELAKEFDISLEHVIINIDEDVEKLSESFKFAGRADPEKIGVIVFFPKAFRSKEELLRTLFHERIHVMQYREYGTEYVQNNQSYFEDLAYDAEEEFIIKIKKAGLL